MCCQWCFARSFSYGTTTTTFSNIQMNTEDIYVVRGIIKNKQFKYIDRRRQSKKNLEKCHSLPLLQLHLR